MHDVLAAAGEGIEGESLAALARDLLVDKDRPLDATGAPTELEALLHLVTSVRESSLWKRAMASPERHMEIPFAVDLKAGRRNLDRGADVVQADVLEGVIDLVFKEGDRWVVADYKTDRGDDPDFPDRRRRYREQVDLYAKCWERLTGEQVGERVIVYTAPGLVDESW